MAMYVSLLQFTEQVEKLFNQLVRQSQLKKKQYHIDQNQCSSGYRCGVTRNRIFNRKHLR